MSNPNASRPELGDHRRAWWRDYAMAVAAVAVATVLRLALDPALGDVYPFVTYFGAVAVVAWFGRTRPAVFTLVVGSVLAFYLFVAPRHQFTPADPAVLLGMGLFVIIAAVVIAMSHAMRAARTRAEHLLAKAIVTQDELRQSVMAEVERREQLRTTLASIGDAVITTDTAGRVTNLNAVAESLTGWTNGEAVGQQLDAVFRIVSEGTRQPLASPSARAVKDGVIVGLANHTVLISRDNTERPIDGSAAPIRSGTGEVVGCVLVFRDITERHRQDAVLRASEARFRELAEAMPQIVYECDAVGRVVFANRQWFEYTGQRDAQTADLGACVHPADLGDMVHQWETARAAGTPFQAEFRLRRHADDEYRWFLTRSVPVRDDAGRVVKWFGTSTDVHDQQQSGRRLAESEARYRAIGESIDFGVWVCDAEGRNIYASESFLQLLGITQQQWSDSGWGDLLDAADTAGTTAAWQECVRTHGTWDREHRVRGTDGRWYDVLARGAPLRDSAGHVLGWAGINLDVTRLVQTEREVVRLAAESDRQRRLYETVLTNTPDFIYTFDLEGRFVYVNAALLALWGKNLDEAVGRNFFDLDYPPDLADRLQRQIQQVIETRQSIRDETPYTGRWGLRMYEYILAPVVGAGHAVEAVAGSTRDITDRKLAEAERERLVSQLRDQDRRKDEFLATLAHELRNPLAPLRNGLQVIRMTGADGKVEQVRSMMERQLGQMTRLVDDLLDASRVTSGKLQLRKTRVDLRAVLDAAVETSRPAIAHAGHDLAIVVPEDPVLVDGDPIRLAQVVSNLLTNSARYSHRSGHIRVSVAQDDTAAVVTVTDDGIGIPTAMLEAVFGMFTQVDRTLEKTTGGLGIGLSLVKGLVEMHGGTVSARSEGDGRGSEFTVRLPLATSMPSDSEPGADAIGVVPAGLRRVLIVDDNVDSAESLAQLLGMLGIEVRTAYDGEAGLEAARAFRPGVVLCDIGMPKLNGYNVARRLRAEAWGQQIVLVALTGWGQEDDRKMSAAAGFDHHLVKPVDDAALMRLLAGWQAAKK